ncbi:nuclear transport factor 2 family protein [Nocardia sp. NPDC005745]|uniref:nuclear transport factor 2 family protein n=1 Tax=Nocardia sp. NPDC005745 TaxID=3157061 RepID=UPI0033FBA154
MSDNALKEQVQRLIDRQEIHDVIIAFARSVDRLDRDLYETTYHRDALDDHGVFVGGRADFYDWMEPVLREQRHSTQHFMGNHTVEIDGDTAHAETYFITSSMTKQGKPFSMVGGRYIDQLVREDGRWSVLKRVLLTDWQLPLAADAFEQPDPAALGHFPPREQAMARARELSRRDRQDISYQRPLTISPARLEISRKASEPA